MANTALCRIGDVCAVRKGATITEKEATLGTVPVVAGGMKPSYFHGESNRLPAVVTISASGANAGFVSYWDCPIWASDCTTVEPINPALVSSRFVFHYLKSVEASVISSLRRGAAQPHVYARDLQELLIPLPPIEEQRWIAAVLDAADALRAKRRQALAKLDTLSQAIFLDMFGDPSVERENEGTPLSTVATIVTGNTPPRSEPANFGSDIEWIKSDNIQTSGVVTKASEGLSAQGRRRGRLAPPGACLVVCIAGSPESIGRVGLLDREVAFNQQINAVVPGDELLPEFLLGQLRAAKRRVQRASTNSMKGMVSKSALCDIRVLVPPLSDQAAFSARVRSCSELMRMARLSLEQMDALLASLQHRAFRGEL